MTDQDDRYITGESGLNYKVVHPARVLIDGCVAGWLVGRSVTNQFAEPERYALVRNGVSGLLEELTADRVVHAEHPRH